MRIHYETDGATWPEDTAYKVRGFSGIACRVLGWEIRPDEHTVWSGVEERTGKVVVRMVGDDARFAVDPDDVTAIPRKDYCSECGQIGCCHDGLDRSEGAE
jgi:hypothetical protein